MQADAHVLQARAATASRQAVAMLRDAGLPVRDVAMLLKVSPQRVSQLLRTTS